MSIFKESFRDFVKKQMELRQSIISLGNNGESRFNSRTHTFSTAAGGKEVTIPYGAFFANTLNRTCVIRMSSGADLTQAGVYNVLDQWELDQGFTAGNDLAKLYILEGGVLNVGGDHDGIQTRTAKADFDFKTMKNTTTYTDNMDWMVNAKPKSGWTNAVNQKNSAYGDAITRGNSINKMGDDYGIVPMPGIVDAQIKTKSAYGSIREAKINFKCHNQRQLEILELLYMRPGVPVLLEWGWTTYVNNAGKLITDSSLPLMPEFWDSTGSGGMNKIYRNIINNKEKTSGNYDGLMGMVKNFSFKARKDGGFDCSTELTAMGEMIESLKGRQGDPNFSTSVLAPFTVAGVADSKSSDREVAELGELYDAFKPDEGDLDAFQLILIDLQCYTLMTDEVFGYTQHVKSKTFNTISGETIKKVRELWKNSDAENIEFVEDYIASLGRAYQYFDLDKLAHYYPATPGAELDGMKMDYLTNFVLHHGVRNNMPGYKHEDVTSYLENNEKEKNDGWGKLNDIDWKGAGWKTGFIKWDAVAYLLNKYAITPLANDTDKNSGTGIQNQSENEPLIKIATKYIEFEEANPGGQYGNYPDTGAGKARLRPYTYIKTAVHNLPPDHWFSNTPSGTTNPKKEYPHKLCDRSFDHKVCFLPHGCTKWGSRGFPTSDYMYYSPFDLMYLSSPKDPKRNKVNTFIKTSKVKKEEQLRSIGNIMFNLDHLINTYQEMAYEKEDETYVRKDDFSIYKFIEKIWSNVNRATGGVHKFIPQVDHEKSDIIRIIDMQAAEHDLPNPEEIHQMNIQGNSTIVRDFTYNSLIPSALSATIGIAMQNPDSIEDLDGATFAAMAKNIKSRFIENKGYQEEKPVTSSQITKWKEKYEKRYDDVKEGARKLTQIASYMRIGYGQTDTGDIEAQEGRGSDEPFDVTSGPMKQKSLYKNMLRLNTFEGSDGTYSKGMFKGKKYYKGQPKPSPKMPNASSVIPLKFNCKMDGIGGIVIGNVFTIDPTRLPRGYKGSDIAFVTTGESQKITAGNDWTTTINGQLTLLPFKTPTSTSTVSGGTASGPAAASPSSPASPATPSTPAAGMTKLSELKNTVVGAGNELTPFLDLISELEGTSGPYPYGVYNFGRSSPESTKDNLGKHPCSSVKGSRSNKDALKKAPINTLTMKELKRRQYLPQRVPANDACAYDTGGGYSDGKEPNGCQIFAAGKYQIIPKTMNGGTLGKMWNDDDIFDAAMQEKLGAALALTKRSRLSAYLKGSNTGTEKDLINAVNEMGWEWASSPIIGYPGKTYAKNCKGTMSSVMGSVKTGAGNQGAYCDKVNKGLKKTFVKNVVINLIHSRWQLAQKEGGVQLPDFRPDFMEFDLNEGDTLNGTKQIGIS